MSLLCRPQRESLGPAITKGRELNGLRGNDNVRVRTISVLGGG